jgi:integrase
MVLEAPPQSKIPTKIPQPSRAGARRPAGPARGGPRSLRAARPGALLLGDARPATRGDGRVVLELECGVTVYPARGEGGRWRAVWMENGTRRQCEAATEDRLAARLDKVTERLMADAPNLERPGADLIAWYLSPDRHPAGRPWSAKHADTQRRLCERFVAPVIAAITCQDIKTADMQRAVSAAPTAGEGARLHRCLSAMVTAGITGGYLTNPRLREVHWQPAGRPAPGPQVSMQGESAQFVDPSEIPAAADVARLGQALAAGRRGDLHELMANTAAYTGLRQGELFALTAGQIDPAARVIDVDRKVIGVSGKLLTGAPKGRKRRKTIYPARTPQGYPLAEKIAARIQAARAEQDAGTNPLGLMFPSPRGVYWRSSNFDRRVLAPAYLTAGWRDAGGNGPWTWHSLRHVLCTTALFTWKLDATDVSAIAGHANVRTTLDMYIGTTAGVLDRARTATA